MRRAVAAVLVAAVVAAPPTTAYAQDVNFGEVVGLVFLFTFDVIASVGGTVTLIGSAVQLQRDPPALGWSIASIVVGGLAGLLGCISVAALVALDVDGESDETRFLWAMALVPLAVSAGNLSIGIVNFSRWGKAKREPKEEEYEELQDEEWTRGFAPGGVISVRF